MIYCILAIKIEVEGAISLWSASTRVIFLLCVKFSFKKYTAVSPQYSRINRRLYINTRQCANRLQHRII
jgi:hypothetical protein